MLIPAVLGALIGEMDTALGLVLGACVGLSLGAAAELTLPPAGEIGWGEGMVATGLTWLVAPLVCAIPLYLSGHFDSFLHAYFDGMSALTCTGLSVLNDLDHVPDSLNLWRRAGRADLLRRRGRS
ncbi:hypothetical protein BH23ACT9_BH23ACT9_00990 [soil metagenome]